MARKKDLGPKKSSSDDSGSAKSAKSSGDPKREKTKREPEPPPRGSSTPRERAEELGRAAKEKAEELKRTFDQKGIDGVLEGLSPLLEKLQTIAVQGATAAAQAG